MSSFKQRKRYPKDIGKRWCITCARETYFKWSDSQNCFICEQCQYEKSMIGAKLILSEKAFLEELKKL